MSTLNFKEPKNRNYAAVVTTVRAITPLEKCDNVVGVPVFGYQAIVGKDTAINDLVVVFPAECQLSHEFSTANNLYRDATKNSNPEAKGYIEDNRRVRAIKFRGHRSDALIMPLKSLEFTGVDTAKICENDTFDEINGISICSKYEIIDKNAQNRENQSAKKVKKAFKRVDAKFLPEHYDTDMWYRNSHRVADDEMLIITQKIHGCFPANTAITMADGSQKNINKIIPGDYVLGYENGKLISTKVLNAAITGNTDSWVKIKFIQPFIGDKPTTVSTACHKFYTTNRGYVRADDLNDQDKVLYQHWEEEVTNFKRSVLTGMLLGDASTHRIARKTNRWPLHWSHAAEHEEYMNYISHCLGNVVRNKKFEARVSGYGTQMLRSLSGRLHQIKNIVKPFYTQDGKRTVPSDLKFDPIILAFWYMDDGSLAHHESQEDRAYIAICRYDDQSSKNLVDALIRFGFNSPKCYKDSTGFNRLRFNKDDADMLFKIIRKYVPPVMQYKLAAIHRGYFEQLEIEDNIIPVYCETTMISKEVIPADGSCFYNSVKYDIETETHNFFARKILVHNSSIRISHIPVLRELTWKDKIAKFFGIPVVEKEYAHVYGSRKVIKDVNNPNQNHFYDDDIWSMEGKKYDAIIPENYIVYGELIGYTPTGAAIQSDYTYNVPTGQVHLYVYRIAIITHGGRMIDLPWNQVKKFCVDNGLQHVPELTVMTKKAAIDSGYIESLMDIRYFDASKVENGFHFNNVPLSLSDSKRVDEGVCIRVERDIPHIFKAKSPLFYAYETKQLDAGIVDMETEGAVSVE